MAYPIITIIAIILRHRNITTNAPQPRRQESKLITMAVPWMPMATLFPTIWISAPDTPSGVKVNQDGCSLDTDGDGVPDYLDKCPGTPSGVKVDKDGCPPPPPPVAQTSKTLFVLLPDPDGKIGQVEVSTSDGSQVLGKAFESTEVLSSDKIPGPPKVMDEKAVRDIFKDALDAQPATPSSFIMYFDSGKATPIKKSVQLIPEILEAIKARKSNSVVVAGHTDTVGAVEYNQKLSELRAKSVADALVAKGVDKAIIAIEFYGEERLLVETPDNVTEPGNRRVEIIAR